MHPQTHVEINALTIRAPPDSITLPLPIPVHIPRPRNVFTKHDVEAAHTTASPPMLDQVHAHIKRGQLYAILGGSGSGKTTLLHAMAHRAPSNLIFDRERIRYFGQRSVCAFVAQEPKFLPLLTIRESIAYVAALKLPHIQAREREQLVQSTIDDLSLSEAASTRVRQCSGGEQRRLSIACALVANPGLVILDEATTGLDASTALQILILLKQLAQKQGKTIVISIHAPRTDAIKLFDRLLILTQGTVAFEGEMHRAVDWFESAGFTLPEHTNPLDWMIDLTSVDSRTDEAESRTRQRVTALIQAWRDRPADEFSSTAIESRTSIEEFSLGDQTKSINLVTNWSRQSLILTHRGLLCNWRDWPQTMGFASQFILLSVIIGLAFYDPPQTPGGIQTMKTALFQNIVATYYLSFIVAIYLFCDLFLVYDRESQDGLYGSSSFILSIFFSYLPLHLIFPTIYAIVFYFLAGFRSSNLVSALFVYIGTNVLQQLGSFGYASIWAALNRNFAQASLYANGFVIMFVLSAGYLILPDSIPVYVKWIRWLNPYFYAFVWTAKSQFESRRLTCTEPQCNGEAILTALQIPLESPKWVYAIGLAAYSAITYLIAVLVLHWSNNGGIRHASKKESTDVKAEKGQLPDAPFASPAILSLQDVKTFSGDKPILDIPFASFSSNTLTGILGPSGSGKSTTLSLLSGHLSSSLTCHGAVTLNGRPISSSDVACIAFVPQSDDHLLPALTVRETLIYATRLRQPHLTKEQCSTKAEEVLRVLGLKGCGDTLVGNSNVKGISGGEKRRLSLGMDLVGDPSILVCDEPTSGLDAAQSLAVMDCLVRIASGTGCAVIASLHQPRSEIFDKVDRILMLAGGGKVAYEGTRVDVLKSFETLGLSPPSDWTLADWLLDMVTRERQLLIEKHAFNYEKSNRLAPPQFEEKTASEKQDKGGPSYTGSVSASAVRHGARQLPVVLQRNFKNMARQQDIFVARLANAPFLALLFCLFFQRLGNSPGDVQNRIGILQENSALPFVGMLASLALFPSERASFLHDWASPGRYSPTVFLTSYTIQEIPLQVGAALLYTLLVEFVIIKDYNEDHFFEFFIGIFALLNNGESIGIIFSSWVESATLSVSLVSVGLTVSTQISGIFSVTMPGWLRGIGKAFPFTFSSQVTLVNQFSGRHFDCTPVDVASGKCIAKTGDDFLQSINIQSWDNGRSIGIMLALVVAFRILALCSLYLRVILLKR